MGQTVRAEQSLTLHPDVPGLVTDVVVGHRPVGDITVPEQIGEELNRFRFALPLNVGSRHNHRVRRRSTHGGVHGIRPLARIVLRNHIRCSVLEAGCPFPVPFPAAFDRNHHCRHAGTTSAGSPIALSRSSITDFRALFRFSYSSTSSSGIPISFATFATWKWWVSS